MVFDVNEKQIYEITEVYKHTQEAKVAAARDQKVALISVMDKVQSTGGLVRRLAGEVLRSGGISAPAVSNGFGEQSLEIRKQPSFSL